MSTTETKPFIPSEETETVGGGGGSWRFAKGKIVRGKEIVKNAVVDGQEIEVETGTYPEERLALTGLLRRLCVFEGTNKFGPVHRLEADIETEKDGVVHVSSSLLDQNNNFKVGISAANFAWCLLQYDKDAPMRIETKLGDPIKLPNGKPGGRATYVNAFEYKSGKFYPIYRPKRVEGAAKVSLEDQWAELETQLRAHPAWKEREIQVDDDTHLGVLANECKAKGWPTPMQATPEWLKMIAGAFKHEVRSSLRDYDDEEWGKVREALQKVVDVPAPLAAAAARLETKPAGGELDAGAFGS